MAMRTVSHAVGCRKRSKNDQHMPWTSLTGAAFGTFAFLGELSEGPGTLPVARLLIVASVFLGLAIVGLLLAYLCLGVPLGLGPQART